jgi:hypothetical protein|tara:strand:+ start:2410 stop:2661 length:252 start_codon:yes stop_codon:yes gene_type:complete
MKVDEDIRVIPAKIKSVIKLNSLNHILYLSVVIDEVTIPEHNIIQTGKNNVGLSKNKKSKCFTIFLCTGWYLKKFLIIFYLFS